MSRSFADVGYTSVPGAGAVHHTKRRHHPITRSNVSNTLLRDGLAKRWGEPRPDHDSAHPGRRTGNYSTGVHLVARTLTPMPAVSSCHCALDGAFRCASKAASSW